MTTFGSGSPVVARLPALNGLRSKASKLVGLMPGEWPIWYAKVPLQH